LDTTVTGRAGRVGLPVAGDEAPLQRHTPVLAVAVVVLLLPD